MPPRRQVLPRQPRRKRVAEQQQQQQQHDAARPREQPQQQQQQQPQQQQQQQPQQQQQNVARGNDEQFRRRSVRHGDAAGNDDADASVVSSIRCRRETAVDDPAELGSEAPTPAPGATVDTRASVTTSQRQGQRQVPTEPPASAAAAARRRDTSCASVETRGDRAAASSARGRAHDGSSGARTLRNGTCGAAGNCEVMPDDDDDDEEDECDDAGSGVDENKDIDGAPDARRDAVGQRDEREAAHSATQRWRHGQWLGRPARGEIQPLDWQAFELDRHAASGASEGESDTGSDSDNSSIGDDGADLAARRPPSNSPADIMSGGEWVRLQIGANVPFHMQYLPRVPTVRLGSVKYYRSGKVRLFLGARNEDGDDDDDDAGRGGGRDHDGIDGADTAQHRGASSERRRRRPPRHRAPIVYDVGHNKSLRCQMRWLRLRKTNAANAGETDASSYDARSTMDVPVHVVLREKATLVATPRVSSVLRARETAHGEAGGARRQPSRPADTLRSMMDDTNLD